MQYRTCTDKPVRVVRDSAIPTINIVNLNYDCTKQQTIIEYGEVRTCNESKKRMEYGNYVISCKLYYLCFI